PAVLAARRSVGLLERLEYNLLLVDRDSDTCVGHRECHNIRGAAQDRMIEAPSLLGNLHLEIHLPFLCELEGVREQIPQDLLQSARICLYRLGQFLREFYVEVEPLVLRYLTEGALYIVSQIHKRQVVYIDRHRSRFYLR